MARRSDHSYRELRDLIIDAAYDIVQEQGVESLSARNLATKISYSVGTLYNIFSNMNEIILHLNARVLDHFVSELANKLNTSVSSSIENLLFIARYYLYFSENHYNLWHMLFINKIYINEDAPKWYKGKIAALNKLVSHQISLFNAPGIDTLLETSIYWASVHGVVSLNNSEKLRYASEKNVDEILESAVRRIFLMYTSNA